MALCAGYGENHELRIGPNYKKFGKKDFSKPALFDFVGAAVLQAPRRLANVLSTMPDLLPPGDMDGRPRAPRSSAVTDYVVFNAQVPVRASRPLTFPTARAGGRPWLMKASACGGADGAGGDVWSSVGW